MTNEEIWPPLDLEDRARARRDAEEHLRQQLAEAGMEGPYRFPAEGMFGGALSSMLGHQGKDMFAICTKCGVLVLLNDLVEDKEGRVIERSATKHAQWHEEERG